MLGMKVLGLICLSICSQTPKACCCTSLSLKKKVYISMSEVARDHNTYTLYKKTVNNDVFYFNWSRTLVFAR